MTIRRPVYWLVLLMGMLLAVFTYSQVASDPADAQSDNPAGETTGFLKVGEVPGESQVVGYEGWSDILAFQLGAFSSGFETGALSNPGSGSRRGAPTIEELIVVKELDSAGTYLAQFAINGNSVSTAELDLVAPSADNRIVYYEIKLENARITSYSVGTTGQKDLTPAGLPLVAASSAMPVEQITLGFEKITVTYTEQAADGSAGEAHTFTYDLKTNK